MEWDHDIDLTRRRMTTQLIIQRALARGWRVCGFKTVPPLLRLYIPGKDKPVTVYSAAPPQMSYPATKIAKDKFVTNIILGDNGLPVPDELLAMTDGSDSQAADEFIARHGKVVVKPLDASHGKGITVNVDSPASYQAALVAARLHTTGRWLVVQEQLSGVDLRVVCINYEYSSAITRLPGSVTGDGRHTVRQLIEATNQSSDRGLNYVARLNKIPLDKAETYLGGAAMDRIPASAEAVQVIGVSNVGMGGVRKNLDGQIPEFLKQMAIEASKALELPVCGVDFIVNREPRPTDTIADLDPRIIEANECPALPMFETIQSAGQLAVIDRYLDYVATY